ncbi:MAG: FtsX-like permease family protein [Clostridiales bacterium]|jgi:putative ABC transport system permease protein|nr:FtsX-like permease family protein [Eubacteriales bacterium]MDH7567551.1 FtsX-like permease family protein [Clostridiales bacterium]
MNILYRKMIRDLWEAKGQFIAIFVIVVLGVMFYTGINATFRNLSLVSEKYYRDYRFEDLSASLYRAPESVVERIGSLDYVKMATGRLVQQVKITISGENAEIRLITLPDIKEDVVDDIALKSGKYFSSDEANQCLVEEEFFKAHGLAVGDYLYPVIHGAEVKLKVIGSVKSPEYVYPLKDSGELMPDNLKFGIVYIKNSFGQSVLGYSGSVNNICLLLDKDADIKKAKDDIKKILEPFGVTEVIERSEQISNKMLSEEMRGLKSTGSAFPIVFFIVAAVIIYIMLGRMVENQRGQIGVLKAFGFGDRQILAHYLSYSVFIGMAGSAVGSLLGVPLAKFYTELENQYFHLPPADVAAYPDLVLPATLLTLSFCLLAGYNSCKRVFRFMPSEAMRPKAPKAGKRIFIERIGAVWKNMDYSWKIILRNIFRYKRRAFLTSIGVIFSSAIVVLAFSMNDSINFMVEQQYRNIQSYDIKVNFSKFISTGEMDYIRKIPHVSRVEPVIETGMEISSGWKKKDIGFTALISSPEIYRVTDREGRPVNLPSSGILIPEKLAKALDVKTGDKVYMKPFIPGGDKKEVAVKGIVVQYLGLSAYGSMDSAAYLLGGGGIANSLVIKLDSDGYEKDVIKKLKEIPDLNSLQSKSDSLNNLQKNLGAMTSAIGLMIVLAAILSIAVVYNIATINIFERQRELATLKVLGFKNNEIRKLVFTENFAITFFGILLGLPLGSWMSGYIMASFETEAYSFPFVARPGTYVLSAVLTAGFTVLANAILNKKINSIDMVEVLKSNE